MPVAVLMSRQRCAIVQPCGFSTGCGSMSPSKYSGKTGGGVNDTCLTVWNSQRLQYTSVLSRGSNLRLQMLHAWWGKRQRMQRCSCGDSSCHRHRRQQWLHKYSRVSISSIGRVERVLKIQLSLKILIKPEKNILYSRFPCWNGKDYLFRSWDNLRELFCVLDFLFKNSLYFCLFKFTSNFILNS